MPKEELVIGLLKGNKTQSLMEDDPGIYGYTSSVMSSGGDSTFYTGGKSDFLEKNAKKPTSETIANAASITKIFTAATILSMNEHKAYRNQFPLGVDTPLSYFENDLRKHYPNNAEFFDYLREQLQYNNVTLRHLMQHTHGLGSRTPACLDIILEDTSKQWGAAEALQASYLRANKEKAPFGKYDYSNTGYDLLGAIIETAASKAKGKEASYASMVREFVINPLGLKNTYTYEDVIAQDKHIAHGYIDNQIKGTVEQDHPDRFTFAAGMIRSTPSDINMLTQRFFAEDLGKSMFTSQLTIFEMNRDLDKHGYGLGFKIFSDKESGKVYKGHDGASWGVQSLAMYDPQTGKSACYVHFSEGVSSSIAKDICQATDQTKDPSKEHILEVQRKLLKEYTPQELVNQRKKITHDVTKNIKDKQLDALDLATKIGKARDTLEEPTSWVQRVNKGGVTRTTEI